MTLLILTPEKEIFKGNASSVKVPGSSGEFEILNNHAPIVSSLSAGKIRIITDTGNKILYTIDNGFVEVLNNEVSLLVRGLTD